MLHIQLYERHSVLLKLLTMILLTDDPGNRAVQGVFLRPLTWWDCGFESRGGYDTYLLWVMYVVR